MVWLDCRARVKNVSAPLGVVPSLPNRSASNSYPAFISFVRSGVQFKWPLTVWIVPSKMLVEALWNPTPSGPLSLRRDVFNPE
jgi:hypothetical protein